MDSFSDAPVTQVLNPISMLNKQHKELIDTETLDSSYAQSYSPSSSTHSGLPLLIAPSLGPRESNSRREKRKRLLLDDEALSGINIEPRCYVHWKVVLFNTISVLTAGTVAIVANWPGFTRWRALAISAPCSPSTADFCLVQSHVVSNETSSSTSSSSRKQQVETDDTSLEICLVEEINEQTLEQMSISEARERTQKKPPRTLPLDLRMVVYRHTRFLLRNSSESIVDAENKSRSSSTNMSFIQLDADEAPPASIADIGLSTAEAASRLRLFGQNAIDVPIPPWPILLIRECIHPFVIFQVWAVIVWLTESYWSFSLFILCMAILTAVMNFLDVRKNLAEIRRISLFTTSVRVIREGKEVEINSSGLVPGDIVNLCDPAMRLPCDMVLIKGQCTVTEAMLTGEAVVVVKQPLPQKQSQILAADIAAAEMRNTLCGGTQIVELRPSGKHDRVLAIVVRTGFSSVKGRLVLSILHPKAPAFKFMQEGMKFLGILFFCAMIGFAINAKALADTGTNVGKIVQRGCDMITIVVPPALPLALTVGTMFALIALRRRNIYCISPARVNLAGKINCFVFDKTGTLTTDGLALSEIRPVSQRETASSAVFAAPVSTQEDLPRDLLACIACCHSLTFVSGKLAGDPLEVETFSFSKGSMEDVINSRSEPDEAQITSALSRITFGGSTSLTATPTQKLASTCDVVRQFEFTPQLQRMGVLARTSDGKGLWSFVKGSPESLKQLCIPSTIPADFEAVLASYARRGLRVLGCGARFYNLTDPQSAVLAEPLLATTRNVHEIDAINAVARQSSEVGLTFFGFIVLENKLKSQTKPTILRLRDEANLLLHMATGDNAVSAVAIARECGIIKPNMRVYLGDFPLQVPSTSLDASLIEWKDVDSDGSSPFILDPLSLVQKEDTKRALGAGGVLPSSYTLAMTGRAFSAFEAASIRSDETRTLFRRAIINCSVFARMSPENKGSLVEELQSIGLYVGMIGDGANDTLALRAAHVGISLSQVEASVAAPFTYAVSDPSIDAIPSVLLEGRGALATSFSLFQFMALYSTIQFANALLIVFAGSFLSNNMYLYQDLWVVLILSLTLGNTAAATRLTKKRPSGRLFSAQNLLITFGFILLTFLGQGIAFAAVKKQSWYNTPEYPAVMDPEKDKEGTNSATPETTSVFLIASLQFVACASIFSRGQPWKSSPLTNKPFIIWLLVCFISSLVLFLAPSQGLYDALSLQLLPKEFNILLLIIASFSFASYFIAMYALQYAKEHTQIIRSLEETFFRGPPKAHKAIRQWWESQNKNNKESTTIGIQITSRGMASLLEDSSPR